MYIPILRKRIQTAVENKNLRKLHLRAEIFLKQENLPIPENIEIFQLLAAEAIITRYNDDRHGLLKWCLHLQACPDLLELIWVTILRLGKWSWIPDIPKNILSVDAAPIVAAALRGGPESLKYILGLGVCLTEEEVKDELELFSSAVIWIHDHLDTHASLLDWVKSSCIGRVLTPTSV